MAAGAATTAAQAQDIGQSAPALPPLDREYTARGLRLGAVQVGVSASARLEYDGNVYAEPEDTRNDVIFIATPRVTAVHDGGALQLRASAEGRFRRYFDLKEENSNGAHVVAEANWRPDTAQALTALVRWTRAIEDRGDPEARVIAVIGPRRTDVFGAELSYNREQGRLGLGLEALVEKYDPLSRIDADREYTNYAGVARVEYRLSGLLSASLAGFVNRRDFAILAPGTGVNRSATTYGARAGIAIKPGGLIEGRAAAGLFRFDSDDPGIPSRTGLSISASMIYRPTQRTAVILDAFRGDVATFRFGAQARTDTRVRLEVQQEIRHNLRGHVNAFYRRSDFIGSGTAEKTVGLYGELEYLFTRNLAVALNARFSRRRVSNPREGGGSGPRPENPEPRPPHEDNFDRFRGGIELRLAF